MLLLAENANVDVNAESNDGSTALMLAASRGKDGCLRALIETGKIAPPSQLGKALQLAAKFGHPECVKLLIEAGADKEYHDWSNPKTPKQLAIKGLHDECVCIITGKPYLRAVDDYILKNPRDTKMIIDTLSNWVKKACNDDYIDYTSQDVLKPRDKVRLLVGRLFVKDTGKVSYLVEAIADQNGLQLAKLVDYKIKFNIPAGPNASTLVAIGKEQKLEDAIKEINELIARHSKTAKYDTEFAKRDTKKSSLKI